MYSNAGKPAFEVDSTFDEDRKVGQLVRIKPNGKITNKKGEGDLFYFPLIEKVVAGETKAAGIQTVCIAMVYVETAASIAIGSELGVGATGIGVAVHTTGYKLGMAMALPKDNGDYIPVLLAPAAQGSNY